MAVLPRLLFMLVLVVVPVVVFATSSVLPERVATHFGRGGYANGWMTHDGYLAFILAFTTLLPLFIVATTGLVPRLATSGRMIANREYWLAPERREASLYWLGNHGCWMGILVLLFIGGIHFLTLDANRNSPPRLDESLLPVVIVPFIVALAVWILVLVLRFRRIA